MCVYVIQQSKLVNYKTNKLLVSLKRSVNS